MLLSCLYKVNAYILQLERCKVKQVLVTEIIFVDGLLGGGMVPAYVCIVMCLKNNFSLVEQFN